MTNKEKYRQLCETEGARIPLFQQYWWMETVCKGKQWDVLLEKHNGRIVGAWPYLIGHRLGLRYILPPQLTPFSGPWVNIPNTTEILFALTTQLRKLHTNLFLQHFSPTITDSHPFLLQGYNITYRRTYRFDPIPEPEKLLSLAAKDRRRGTDAVKDAYKLDKAVGTAEFVDFHISYWERRSGKDLLSRDFMARVVQTALDRQQALLYGLRDYNNRLMAARFVVYDSQCAHSLLSALHPDALRNTMTVLTWHIITDLYSRTQIYDFEGSMDPGIAHFYRSFGSSETPYFEVSRCRPKLLKYLLR
ncbi:MAG: GNAT family N-acetyltransferase [Bacteroidales bacterium]|nr:GNAT family N-acetyltransferase [Bacteroidales bacterium]